MKYEFKKTYCSECGRRYETCQYCGDEAPRTFGHAVATGEFILLCGPCATAHLGIMRLRHAVLRAQRGPDAAISAADLRTPTEVE